jgi:hypothetical protein
MATAFGEDTAMLPQGPMVVPIKYQIRLTVDGKASVQPLTVAMDPRVKTPPADLQKQFDLGMKIWEALRTEQSPRKRAALAYAHVAGGGGVRRGAAGEVGFPCLDRFQDQCCFCGWFMQTVFAPVRIRG